MPQSIYDSGGVIGATLDFTDTSVYQVPFTGNIPFSVVGSSSSVSSTTIVLPTGLVQNDFVVLFVSADDLGATINATSLTSQGWTLRYESPLTGGLRGAVYSKFMGTTPDTSVTSLYNQVVTPIKDCGTISVAFRGVPSTSPITTASTWVTVGETVALSSITTTVPSQYLLSLVATSEDNSSATIPGNTAQLKYVEDLGTTANAGITTSASFFQQSTAGSFSPGTATTSNDNSAAITIAIDGRGTVGTSVVNGNRKNSGIWSLSAVLNSIRPPVTSLTFVSFANTPTSGTNVILPATAQNGDIAIFFTSATVTQTFATLPPNFIDLNSSAAGSTPYRIGYFLVDGSVTPGTTSFNPFASGGKTTMLVYRPNRKINSVTSSNFSTQATTATPTNQVLPAITNALSPTIAFAQYRSSGSITTRGSTQTMTETTGDTGQFIKHAIYNPGSSVGSNTISMNDAGTNILQSLRITVS